MKSLRVRTPAKINLFLRVLGVRPDGYHDLETLFQAIDLDDELTIAKGDTEATLRVPGFPELETENNLVMRALRRLEAHTGRQLSVCMTLSKKIPAAAGLGGGSSDAAAALKGLSHLFDLGLSDQELAAAALTLGADVPFFLTGGTAVGEGIGERLTPVTLPFEYELILVNPGFPVSTASIFREFSKNLTGKPLEGRLWMRIREGRSVEDLLDNDLQSVAEALHPQIRGVRDLMEKAGVRKTLMSGSGPTVFGPVPVHSSGVLVKQFPSHWKIVTARPVTRGMVID
jgi:4-diphosphocytidyl-2-C-methyl-D-erythritol kinase